MEPYEKAVIVLGEFPQFSQLLQHTLVVAYNIGIVDAKPFLEKLAKSWESTIKEEEEAQKRIIEIGER